MSVTMQESVPPQQNLKMSRMSAGFADISQLADEEKEQLDQLIERLEEERRLVAATTQLLSPARPPPIQSRPSSGESEHQRLKDELKNVREYNKELAKELEDIRFNIHSDNHSHASTPHGGAISPIHTTERPHSSPVFYHPHGTVPKQEYASEVGNYPMPRNVTPLYARHEESRPGKVGGETPGHPPCVRSQSYETGTQNSYRSPMKAHPNLNVSSPGNYGMNGGKSPTQIHREFQTHENSNFNDDPRVGEIQHRGALPHRQVLPDAPFMKMNRQPHTFSPASSTRSVKSQYSRHGRSPKIFDGASPEMMFKSLDTSSADKKSNPAASSHDSMTQHRLSPALQQAYQRHLVASGQAGLSENSWLTDSQKSTSRKTSRPNSKDYDTDSLSDSERSTPKVRHNRDHLIDLASSANISSDSLGSHNHKFKPVTVETQLVAAETGHLLHSFERGNSPLDRRSRSSTPNVASISAYVKEPGDLMGSYGSSGFPQRVSSPASVSLSNSHPKPRHSRSRTSTPKIVCPTFETAPDSFSSGAPPSGPSYGSHRPRSRTSTPKITGRNISAGPDNSVNSFSSGVTPNDGSPAPHKRTSHSSTPNMVNPSSSGGSKIFADSLSSGAAPNGGTSTSYRSRSRDSTPKTTDVSATDVDPACIVKRDSHGSFVPPRRVLSQENLNFRKQPIRSVDSDSLHTSPNHSTGFPASDSSEEDVDRVSQPDYLKEFDPYSSRYASPPGEKRSQNPTIFQKSRTNNDMASSSASTGKTSSTITLKSRSFVSNTEMNQDYSHSSISDTGYKMNLKPHSSKVKKQTPNNDTSAHSSMSAAVYEMNQKCFDNTKHPSSDRSSMSDTGPKMHRKSQKGPNSSNITQRPSTSAINSYDPSSGSGSRHKKGPRPVKPQRNPSRQFIHKPQHKTNPHSRSNISSKRNSSANSSRRSTPKIKTEKSESSSEEENQMKNRKTQKSDVATTTETSDESRSTPDGDIEKEFQRSESESRFKSPEDEMKFLIGKLQTLMPSMFHGGPEKSTPTQKMHPMSEVLVAAEQTRKAIELFTDYAIAASAGEGTFL